ncbi:MAG TPA: helix-turn-helix transcriptional regulator [Nanoarchaeota archaeon]|nr:MAG: MarR family transcriptional regulator [archaeon GW2011_AR6]MBS3083148.1 helix-turn-helix transcriptional regulator [Candidatus Pacearchaeota archaeon]HIH17708.1 helix-turn-helix transcriptional regulator [Nanoarchaeota archaeon]HIH33675.1 helix-turn-helix transcriptional regulator [Nanoarchaeota archaeon]HIH51459.1 helix-turn-helix transcriptional regulator [Nanoarchaeota archaeon]
MFDLNTIIEKISFLDKIVGKWYLLILLTIVINDSMGFYRLKKEMKVITSAVLSKKLKILEETKLIGKKILIENPRRVEYFITEEGKKFVSSVEDIFKLNLPSKGY